MHDIKFPIGLHKPSNKLLDIKDAVNGKACECDCFKCGKPFIAVNDPSNEVRQYFRHDKGSDCSVTFESYIHWLTKEIFKSLSSFSIPKITSDNLFKYDNKHFLNQIQEVYNRGKVPVNFRRTYKIHNVIQERKEIQIHRCETESCFTTSRGQIRADIVITSGNNKLIIEPFLTNPIDKPKMEKILELDESVIAIDLYSFVKAYDYSFTVEKFSNYIANQCGGMYWEYFKNEKVLSLQKKFLKKLRSSLEESMHPMKYIL